MDPAPPLATPPAETPSQPEMSLSARLMNVLASPAEVFDYIKTRPHSVANWVVPSVLAIVIGIVAAGFVFGNEAVNHQIDEMMDKQLAAQKLPPQQAEMARKIGGISTKISVLAQPAIMAIIAPFWTGLVFWLVGSKILKGGFGYMKAVEAAGLTGMIMVLDAILRPLLIALKGNLFVSPSLVLFLKDFNPQSPAHALLGLTNIILIWTIIVQSVALSRLSSRSFAVSFAWILGISVVCIGSCMGFGFAMQAAYKH